MSKRICIKEEVMYHKVVECMRDRKRWRKFVHAAPSSATYR